MGSKTTACGRGIGYLLRGAPDWAARLPVVLTDAIGYFHAHECTRTIGTVDV
jgi:hypothetical protein